MSNLSELTEYIIATITEICPPYEDRCAFNLSLPDKFNKAPSDFFASALKNDQILVQLAALRWFQNKPGLAQKYFKLIAEFLDKDNKWLKIESLKIMRKLTSINETTLLKIGSICVSGCDEVKQEALKTLLKIGVKNKITNDEIYKYLEIACKDTNHETKRKALKTLKYLRAS